MEVSEIRKSIFPPSSLLGPPRLALSLNQRPQLLASISQHSCLHSSSLLRQPQQARRFWEAIPPIPAQGDPSFLQPPWLFPYTQLTPGGKGVSLPYVCT